MSAPVAANLRSTRGGEDGASVQRPPRLATALLTRILHGADREYILGDLEETFGRHAIRSRFRAAAWYWGQIPANLPASMNRRATEGTASDARRSTSRHRQTSAFGVPDGIKRPGSSPPRTPLGAARRSMNDLWSDVRQALAGFRHGPGPAAVAIVTLALGIGANAAIFSALNAVVLAPLPYPDNDAIVRILPDSSVARGTMLEFEQRAASFSAISGFAGYDLTLVGEGEPTVLDGTRVSPQHFTVMGIAPFLGRSFFASERIPGSDGVVILSHALWLNRFGGDADILGQELRLLGGGHQTRTVVGVMPAGFRPLLGGTRDFWIPLVADATDQGLYYGKFVRMVGRLNPDTTLEQATAETQVLARTLHEEDPNLIAADEVAAAGLVTLQEQTVGEMRRPLLILSVAAGFVLLLAGCNLVNLLLARSGGRRGEMAIRRALGADRGRLIRQIITETAVLGLCGGIVGLLVAVGINSVLGRFVPAGTPRAEQISIDAFVAVASLVVAVAAGVVAGLLPAWLATRPQRNGHMHSTTRVASERSGRRLNNTIVGAEVALSVVLVVAAGLMFKSTWRLHRVDPGFAAEGVAGLLLSPADSSYPDGARQAAYYEAVIERVTAVAGVDNAAMIHVSPMSGDNWMTGFVVDGRAPGADQRLPSANVRSVTAGYFETLRIPLLAGRTLNDRDREDAPPVVVINEALANEVWPDEDALGQRLHLSREGPPATVVGIVGDVRQNALDESPAGEIYRTYRQWPVGSMYLMVRALGDPSDTLPAVKDAVWSVDNAVPISEVTLLRDVVRDSVADFGFVAFLLGGFGALALTLGGVGVYGVMSYAVGSRVREFGVRLALGAVPRHVVGTAVTEGVVVAGVGISLGVVGALAATRLLQAFLYEVSPTDPATFLVVIAAVSTVAILATWVPARRAGMVDIINALRKD